MSLSISDAVAGKRTATLFPEHIHGESTKLPTPLKHFNLKLFHIQKVIKALLKSLNIPTIATKELYLFKFYKIPKSIPTTNF